MKSRAGTSVMMTLTLAFVALMVSATPVKAASILYFTDGVEGIDRMAEALSDLAFAGATVNTVSSAAEFATEIATGNYDLGILSQQSGGGADFDAAWDTLGAFVNTGGRAIAADWTSFFDGSTSKIALNYTTTGSRNETEVTLLAPQLTTSIINPIALINPGWGTFSYGLGGTCAATFANGDCAIVGGFGGRVWINGFLTDTFDDGFEGAQLYINEINSVLAVPEPALLALFGVGLLLLAAAQRRRATR